MASAQVITIVAPTPPPPGAIVGYDDDNDTPVVVAYTGPPVLAGASVIAVADTPPTIVEGPPGDLDVHIADTTPHPAYDDLPSLSLLFNNGLV